MTDAAPTDAHDDLRARSHRLYAGPIAFTDWTGLRYLRSAPDDTRMHLPFAPHVADARGVIGPGMIATLFDTAAGQVAISAYDWRAQVATVSLQANFIAPPPPGSGLIAEGRVIAVDDGRVALRLRITSDRDPTHVVCETTARMIVTRRVEDEEGASDRPEPAIVPLHSAPFLAGDDMIVHRDGHDAHVITARIPCRPHYMGNLTRGALHGGMVAASLLETIVHLPAHGGARVAPMDVQIDFLRPARDAELVITAEMHLAGSRIGFCSALLEQTLPGRGPAPVARLHGTVDLIAKAR